MFPTSTPPPPKKSDYCILLGKSLGSRPVDEFCSCGKCVALPTAVENVCCRETIDSLTQYSGNIKKHLGDHRCICNNSFVREIVFHESNLNIFSMLNSWKNKDSQNGKRRISLLDPKRLGYLMAELTRCFRHIRFAAYQQLTFYFHGELGMSKRVELPSCIVEFVRKQYPSQDGDYVGFKSSDWIDQ
uniref:P2X purinoreceptor 7 intracellular domain-containing protein n=1 Tax=Panagrolaimus superbus TaxID=310955 RepID=A0A914YJM1_9BILA